MKKLGWLKNAVLGLVLAAFALPAASLAITPEEQVKAMRRGVNIVGYDPLWTDAAKGRFKPKHFKVIKDGGFDTVRFNLHAFAHMDANNVLKPQYLETLDALLEQALSAGLTVILDEHNFNECAKDVKTCRVKLKAFWTQISTRYQNAPETVLFEILNEPNTTIDKEWNSMVAENLAIIRATNPTRNVVVGPTGWNNMDRLGDLKLPAADRNLIVTIHYYTPMEFTHQGASWTPQFTTLGVTWGTDADKAALKANFDKADAWSKANGRPLLLGEFGAYDKGPMASRIAYTSAVAREAESRNWAWAYWQFDSDFVVYDIVNDAWNAPIHGALIPEKATKIADTATATGAPAAKKKSAPVVFTPEGLNLYGPPSKSEILPNADAPGGKVKQVEIPKPQTNPWDIGLNGNIPAEIKKGDKIVISSWAKLISTKARETTTIRFLIQKKSAPYTEVVGGDVVVSAAGDYVIVEGVASGDYAAGDTNFAIQIGQIKRPIQIAGVKVFNAGP